MSRKNKGKAKKAKKQQQAPTPAAASAWAGLGVQLLAAAGVFAAGLLTGRFILPREPEAVHLFVSVVDPESAENFHYYRKEAPNGIGPALLSAAPSAVSEPAPSERPPSPPEAWAPEEQTLGATSSVTVEPAAQADPAAELPRDDPPAADAAAADPTAAVASDLAPEVAPDALPLTPPSSPPHEPQASAEPEVSAPAEDEARRPTAQPPAVDAAADAAAPADTAAEDKKAVGEDSAPVVPVAPAQEVASPPRAAAPPPSPPPPPHPLPPLRVNVENESGGAGPIGQRCFVKVTGAAETFSAQRVSAALGRIPWNLVRSIVTTSGAETSSLSELHRPTGVPRTAVSTAELREAIEESLRQGPVEQANGSTENKSASTGGLFTP